jgi:uncharacterized OB-fold protein
MATDEVKKKVPIVEGLYKLPQNGGEGYLIGSRCNACGVYFHPKRVICAKCFSEDQREVSLSRRGKIYTYTIARVSYPGTPVVAPFVAASVALPENIQVISLITDIDLNNVKIDTEVELHFWKTGEDSAGNDVMAYAFRPVST